MAVTIYNGYLESFNVISLYSLYIFYHTLYIAVTISNISCLVIYPSPSRSYIVKAHLSFCSNLPRDVTERAHRNSRKSIEPSPLASKVRNTCSANFDASPYGKKLPYIFLNSSTLKIKLYIFQSCASLDAINWVYLRQGV